jgi:hypothetical protein
MILHLYLLLPVGVPRIAILAMGIDNYIFFPLLSFCAFAERVAQPY